MLKYSVYSWGLPSIYLCFLWFYGNNYSIQNLKLMSGATTGGWVFRVLTGKIHKCIGLPKSSKLIPWHLCTDEQAHSLCCFSENIHLHKKAVSSLAGKIYPWIASLCFLVSSTYGWEEKRKKKRKQSNLSQIRTFIHLIQTLQISWKYSAFATTLL